MEIALRVMKRQRLVWSAAIIVALVLIFVAHAPVFPVIAGCLIALAATTLRSVLRDSKSMPVRKQG